MFRIISKITIAMLILSSHFAMADLQQDLKTQISNLKKEDILSDKIKNLKKIIQYVKEEYSRQEKIVIDIESEIQKNVDSTNEDLVKKKKVADAEFDIIIKQKIAFESLESLFIKNEKKYHCDTFKEELLKNYNPTGAVKKVKIDTNTQKSIDNTLDLAQHLCKYFSK